MRARILAVLATVAAVLMFIAPTGAQAAETGTIRGQISLSSGGSFRSARVTLWHADGVGAGDQLLPIGRSDYEFTNVLPGDYKLSFTVDGVTQYAHQKLTFADADVFAVNADGVTVVDETMLPGGVVALTITDSVTGQPIDNVCARFETNNPVCGAQHGVLRLTNLPRGDFTIQVFSSDGVHGRASLNNVHVELGQTTEVATALEPLGAITTTVVNAQTNEPMFGVCVLALTRRFGALDRNNCHQSDNAGRVLIGELPAGTYQLFAVPQQLSDGAQWVGPTGGTGDQREALDVRARLGKATAIAPIRIDPMGSITGVLRDATTGAPVPEMCAQALPGDTGPFDPFEGCSDADGHYSMIGLGPYKWPLQFVGQDNGPYGWQWSGGVGDRYSAEQVQVQSAATATLDVNLLRAAQVTGRILDANGNPVSGSAVVNVFNARTGDQAGPKTFGFGGTYTLRALTTERVKISYQAFPRPLTWYDAAPTFADASPVRVRAGRTTEGIDLRFPAP